MKGQPKGWPSPRRGCAGEEGALPSCSFLFRRHDLAPASSHRGANIYDTPLSGLGFLEPRSGSSWEYHYCILKNCLVIKNHLEAVIFKQIWYKTGSQWPGEFSHLGTRSENVLSPPPTPQAAAGQQNSRWGSAGGLSRLRLRDVSSRPTGVVSSSPKPRMRLLIHGQGAVGREGAGQCQNPVFCSSPRSWWAPGALFV